MMHRICVKNEFIIGCNSIQTELFCFLRRGRAGAPIDNYKTAHDRATEITQNNVLMNFNV